MSDLFSNNAKVVLEKRYLKKNRETGELETIEELFHRVAGNIAQGDKKFDKKADIKATEKIFYDLMTSKKFMPNSPTLMNAGADLQQLSACFVLPIGDSIDEIFESIKNAALIHKSGGGTGFSFSKLRPKNDVVRTTSGVSSGPVSFMRAFNVATEVVKQGGTRRGANMGILRVDHPDILEFISSKADTSEFNNFNISVAFTKEFLDAFEKKEYYNLYNPRTKEIQGTLNAADVFDFIVNAAWQNGEPGIIFIDVINNDNPTPEVGEIESTNPCGEQPLLPYEACNLGSINLSLFVKEDGSIDYDELKDTIHKSIHFLDNVIEMNKYPLPQIEELALNNRKIGLGVMGFADMLFMLAIPYNSEEAEKLAIKIMKFIDDESKQASINLAKIRGTFANYEKSIYKAKDMPLRNATVTTIAPTGTISIISDCSSGIEPIFALAFVRNVMDDDKLPEVNKTFEAIAKKEGFYSEEMIKAVAEKGSVKGIDSIPAKWQKVFCISHEIEPEWHIRLQAAFQKHTDNAVSKTINFANSATKDEIREAYLLAYKLGCKGITVYRDGSRDLQVLTIGSSSSSSKKPEHELTTIEVDADLYKVKPRERPRVTVGKTIKTKTACGTLYVTINEDEHGLCEVFATIGKSGGCAYSQAEGLSRLISLSLRSGIDAHSIVKQLIGIRCTSPVWENGRPILSCADAIGNVLDNYISCREKNGDTIDVKQVNINFGTEDTSKPKPNTNKVLTGATCPECHSPLEMSEGCMSCRSCGYSKCS